MKLHVTLGRDVSEYTSFDVEIPDDQYAELRKTGGLDASLAHTAWTALEADLFYSFASDPSTAHSLRIVRAEIPGVARVAKDIALEPNTAAAGQALLKALAALREGCPAAVRPALVEAVRALSVAHPAARGSERQDASPRTHEDLVQALVDAATYAPEIDLADIGAPYILRHNQRLYVMLPAVAKDTTAS
ncbi:hypothetical protein [Acidiferrobacter sp. SPIII_3]|uniref:hypothetical protein n=1 Tax=Acidiferrobacter sp. SPIII_3 TaxID=1281578 RepID=UPI00143E03B9|nr:hypothetical protein [Acidiferrobacter sp. SPIII_3]